MGSIDARKNRLPFAGTLLSAASVALIWSLAPERMLDASGEQALFSLIAVAIMGLGFARDVSERVNRSH